jgi:hypothetical protein
MKLFTLINVLQSHTFDLLNLCLGFVACYPQCDQSMCMGYIVVLTFTQIALNKLVTLSNVHSNPKANECNDVSLGWKCFRIVGQLDFSLVGVLAKISKILSDAGISIFAISTFNTDYILVKKDSLENALKVLSENEIDIA